MRVTAKGQVTIPQDIRESAGLSPSTEVAFEIHAGIVTLVKAKAASRGRKLVERMRGAGDYGMSADEVIALMRGPPAEV